MISFRYHVVSLVAVLLALAAGIVLGGGPLQRSDADSGAGNSGATTAAGRARLAQAAQAVAFGDAYARATAGGLLADKLSGRAVTLVTLPGADQASVEVLSSLVGQAGGSVTAQVSVGRKLLDVANRQLVEELATQMGASAKRAVKVPGSASGYERMSALIAHAVATGAKAGAAVDGPGKSILAGLSTPDLQLVTTQGDITRRGSLVLVLAGEPYGTTDERQGAGSILGTLVTALDAGSDGVVVAGPLGSGAEEGLVGAVRADPAVAKKVSSVDVTDQVAGDVVSILALGDQASGGAGHFGSAGSPDGAVPGATGGD